MPTGLPERSTSSKHGFQFLAKILPGPTGTSGRKPCLEDMQHTTVNQEHNLEAALAWIPPKNKDLETH